MGYLASQKIAIPFFYIPEFRYRCEGATTIKGALGDIQKSINFTRIRLPDDAMDRFTG